MSADLLKKALAAIETLQARLEAAERAKREPIAIVGEACRFPGGADDPEGLWRVVRDGVDAIGPPPAGRDGATDPRRRGGFLPGVDLFDPGIFGISPREAHAIDPQHRLLLETSYEALERAGLAVDALAGSATGVFVGVTGSDYAEINVLDNPNADPYFLSGGSNSAAAGRVSFTFGFHGPSISVDTACSSSLVALHLAVQSLRAGEIDLALAGGVNVLLRPLLTGLLAQMGVVAEDDTCKPFDAAANGFVRSEGCGMLALKRLSDARAAGDPIVGVIRGSAVNSDGRSSGLTVPHGPSQEAVIRTALANAGLQPHDIDYVEAHGTGTPLGDPIEIEALAAALAGERATRGPLLVGSLKSNIGHPESAAGIAGLLKATMAMRQAQVPPTLHLRNPSPNIPWAELAVRVPTELEPWPRGAGPRRAGINSFGFSGTNAHVIVEEPPARELLPDAPIAGDEALLVPFSARGERALAALAARHADFLATEPAVTLADYVVTMGQGRSAMTNRLAVVASSLPELRDRLREFADGVPSPEALRGEVRPGRRPKVAFVFSGGGTAYPRMGRDLYRTQPVFRSALDRCGALLAGKLERPVTAVLFESDDAWGASTESREARAALFALQYALAELWRSRGVRPALIAGRDAGELVAACVAGVFTLEDALDLVCEPGRIVQATPQAPIVPLVSNLTGDVLPARVVPDPAHWRRGERSPVRLEAALRAAGTTMLLEIGPQPALAEQARRVEPEAGWTVLASLREGQDERRTMLAALQTLYVAGVDPVWQAAGGRRTALPTYPFQRTRFWTVPAGRPETMPAASTASAAIAEPEPLALESSEARNDFLAGEIARVLGFEPAALDRDAPLPDLGFDSMMAIRVRNAAASRLGLDVPLRLLMQGSSTAALLDALGSQSVAAAAPSAPAAGTEAPADESRLPLSFGQFGMWFQQQQAPATTVTTIGLALRVTGSLDRDALGRAVKALVDRHPLLRTTYHLDDGGLFARVAGSAEGGLEVRPLGADEALASPPDPREHAGLNAELARPFDLERGPAFRATLFTDGGEAHLILLALHHISGDAWSMGVLLTELLTLYGEFVERRPSALAPPSGTYAAFVRRQQAAISGSEGERLWAYWSNRLAAPRARTALPGDVARPALPSFAGATLEFDLSADLASGVTALAAQTQTTPFVVLLGAFHLLLGRLCDVRDVIVGTPTLGRPTAEDLGVVGDFINEIPVRSRLDDAATVRGFLAEVHESLIGALEAQDFPLSLMIQRLHPAREATGQALFNTSFAMLQPNAAHSRRTVAGATFELESLPFQVGLHDLRLELIASEAGIRGVVKYSTDVFTRTAAERICAEYLALAQAVVAAPDQALGDLRRPLGEGGVDDLRAAALLAALGAREIRLGLDGERLRVDAPKGAVNDADRHAIAELRPAILARLRAGTTDAREANGAPDRTRCLHHLLEAAAAAYPERTAVAGPGGELTYAEFEARANRLAHQLVRAGVRPGVLAAVALERTVNLPVALAAVLKAGGTYVPLDPAHPRERLREIVRDAGAAVLVTEGDLGEVALGTEARVFRLDGEAATDAAWPATPPDVAVRPDDLAYVIYTSGSTGRPKGVEIEHRNLVAFLDAMRREPGLDPNDVLLAVTTISFDIAGLELWLPLSTGARVVLAARADAIDAERLAALMETHGVTVLQATPATWRLLLESGWAGRSELRALCGGEALPQALAARIAGRVGALWNMYGPTETTIWSTVARVAGAGLDAASGLVPIGRPIAGTRVFVVDEDGTPVATGVAGELLIGGEGVARGYRGRPDLTERAFVLRDDGRGPERVYRTGDLARFRADGQLEYLGRRDHQIKLRGYRIEPAEIEAALASRPELTGSLVLVDAETAGDERLVAYVTLAPGASFDPGEVQSALRARLPEYMIPSRIVALPRFPLTPAGKVDRAALALAGASPIAADPPALSRTIPAVTMTAEQARVAALWRDVLRVERVGLHDNFFDIGGHSLLLVRIQAGFKREFGIDLPLVELFERTTVARQAERLAAEARAEVPVHG